MAQSGQATPQAQQQQQTTQKEPDEQQQTGQVNNKDQQKKSASNVSDTFTPSEEISDDLSVSFPVDI